MTRLTPLPPKKTPVPHGPQVGGIVHAYASAACWHGQHDGCDVTCHWCGSSCCCPCHGFRHEGRKVQVSWPTH